MGLNRDRSAGLFDKLAELTATCSSARIEEDAFDVKSAGVAAKVVAASAAQTGLDRPSSEHAVAFDAVGVGVGRPAVRASSELCSAQVAAVVEVVRCVGGWRAALSRFAAAQVVLAEAGEAGAGAGRQGSSLVSV